MTEEEKKQYITYHIPDASGGVKVNMRELFNENHDPKTGQFAEGGGGGGGSSGGSSGGTTGTSSGSGRSSSAKKSNGKLIPHSADDSNLKPEEYPTKGEAAEYIRAEFPNNSSMQFKAKLMSRSPDEKLTEKHFPDIVAEAFDDEDIKSHGYQGSYASGKESNQLKRDIIAHMRSKKSG